MGIRYATKIELKSSIPQVIAVVRKWISTNLDSRFDTEYKNLYYLDEEMESGGRIVGVSAWEAEGGYPISVSLSVDVPDALDHGKYVETQIGMKLLSSGNTLVTIIEDKEDSLQELFINNTLKRPKIVGMLAHSCLPVDSTPGIYICHIGARDCESKIMSDIREKRIVSPVVVVSSTEDGKLLVDQKRLANQLISIADVIVQDPGLDRSVFGKLGAANGGINILWPPDGRDDIQVKRIFPEQLLSYDDPCAAILSAIAERTTWSALKSHIDASYVDKQRGIQRRNIPKKELDEFKRRRVDEIQRRQLTFGAKRPFGKDSKPENTKCKGPRTNNDKNKR